MEHITDMSENTEHFMDANTMKGVISHHVLAKYTLDKNLGKQ